MQTFFINVPNDKTIKICFDELFKKEVKVPKFDKQ